MSDEQKIEIVLPDEPIPASVRSPKNLIIVSKPKVGKTSLAAQLPNCLILDTEEGSDYVNALKIKVNSVKEINAVGKKIKETGKHYDYIALDTASGLVSLCIPYAEKLYSKSPMGKNWYSDGKKKYGNILNMPNGSGYMWLRQAFTNTLAYIQELTPRVILFVHVKDIMLEKEGNDIASLELDLPGLLKRMVTSQSDAIGYLYRKGNNNLISFKTSDKVACGARPEHLRNQEFVISEFDDDNNYVTHWDKIYID